MGLTDKQKDILLKEYAEAGTICRHYEQQTRTSLNFFATAAVAIIGAVKYEPFSHPPTNFIIEMAGFLYGAFLINTILRLRRYYWSYVDRARKIETMLSEVGFSGMQLYTKGRDDFFQSKESKFTVSNKLAIVTVILAPTVYFLVMSVVHAHAWDSCKFILILAIPFATFFAAWLLQKVLKHPTPNTALNSDDPR